MFSNIASHRAQVCPPAIVRRYINGISEQIHHLCVLFQFAEWDFLDRLFAIGFCKLIARTPASDSVEMPWILPGVPPTGRQVELAVVVVVQFDKGLISQEHIYWDQASVLAQVGLIDPAVLPIATAEAVRKLTDPASVPSNELIARGQ